MSVEKRIKQVKETHSLELLSKPFVVAVGIGPKIVDGNITEEKSIRIYVKEKQPEKIFDRFEKGKIPEKLEGISTDVIELGMSSKRSVENLPPERQQRLRPVPGGCSISHYAVNGRGTLGLWVKDKKSGEPLFISCWHVIANYGMCRKGDPVLQPGRKDGGKLPRDIIGHLERWKDVGMLGWNWKNCKERIGVAFKHSIEIPENYIDCALAKPVSREIIDDEILGMEEVDRDIREPERGEEIKMSGATSGIKFGKIIDVDLDVLVEYNNFGIALFKNQAITAEGSLLNPLKRAASVLEFEF